MDTLLSRWPEHGEKTFLTTSEKPRPRRRRRTRGGKKQSEDVAACGSGGGGMSTEPAASGRHDSATFLNEQTPLAASTKQTRTTADEKPLQLSASTTSQLPTSAPTPTPTTPAPQNKSSMSLSNNPHTTSSPSKPLQAAVAMPGATSTQATMTSNTELLPPHIQKLKSAGGDSGHSLGSNLSDITAKLAQFQVKVSDPKPVAKTAQGDSNGWNDWPTESAQPDTSGFNQSQRRGGGSQRGKGRGRGGRRGGGGASAPRNSGWATKADFPKVDTKRHEVTKWDDSPKDWDSHSIASTADGGWAALTKQQQEEWKLAGWDGKLAPAPVDWDSRPAFRPNQSAEAIYDWLAKTAEETVGANMEVNLDDFQTADNITFYFGTPGREPVRESSEVDSEYHAEDIPSLKDGSSSWNAEPAEAKPTTFEPMGDIIPHYWIPIVFPGKKAPQTFWNEIVKSTEPKTANPGDLSGVRPWWEQVVKGSQFLQVPESPKIAGPDPTETTEERLGRENDQGSGKAAENRVNFEKAQIRMQQEKKKKKAEKQTRLQLKRLQNDAPAENLNNFKPTEKIFLRPAHPDDMREIRDIYNHYVDHVCVVPEADRRSVEEMEDRWRSIKAHHFPFIVACIKGQVIKARKRGQEDLILRDKVVGFAFADDYDSPRSIYRFTCEAQVFVHKDHYMKGIGKSMLDKLVALLDQNYLERGLYDTQGDELDGVGRIRLVKHIIINFPYDNRAKLEWVEKWLVDYMGFSLNGHYPGIASKGGKEGSLAVFQYTTGFELDHANPPIMAD